MMVLEPKGAEHPIISIATFWWIDQGAAHRNIIPIRAHHQKNKMNIHLGRRFRILFGWQTQKYQTNITVRCTLA